MKNSIYAALALICLAALSGCDSSSGGGNGGDANAHVRSFDTRECEAILSSDGQPIEHLVFAVESLVEARSLAGEMMNMNDFEKVLDATFNVHCDQKCTVTKKDSE